MHTSAVELFAAMQPVSIRPLSVNKSANCMPLFKPYIPQLTLKSCNLRRKKKVREGSYRLICGLSLSCTRSSSSQKLADAYLHKPLHYYLTFFSYCSSKAVHTIMHQSHEEAQLTLGLGSSIMYVYTQLTKK